MTKFVSAIALLSAAGAANAAFSVRSVDTSSLGSPITVNGSLFQSNAPGAGNFGPTEVVIELSSANQWAEYDSYVAIDVAPSTPGTVGVKNDGFQANPGDIATLGNPFGAAGQIGAVWFMDPLGPRTIVDAPTSSLFGGQNALFLGRFSFRSTTGVPTGSLSLGANGVVVDIRDQGTAVGPDATDSLLVRFSSFDTPVQSGQDGADNNVYATGNAYELRLVAWSAGPRQGGTAQWIGYDMYVVQSAIPTPGTLALAGLGVLVAGRRRRA